MSGLLRRRAMMTGGATLPYDAEVEYLESTGTQYIDTGRVFDSRYKYELTIGYFANNGAGFRCFGARSQYSPRPKSSYLTYYPDTSRIFFYAGNNIPSNDGGATGRAPTLNMMRTLSIGVYPTPYMYINETDAVTPGNYMQAEIFQSEYSLYLFADNTAGSASPHGCRISRYHVMDNDTSVQDLISVRVGSVGYLYDRVSDQLFGNAGSGAFVVGPDV